MQLKAAKPLRESFSREDQGIKTGVWRTQAVDQTATGFGLDAKRVGEGSRLHGKYVGEERRCALGTSVLSLSSTWLGSVPFLISEQQWVQHVQIGAHAGCRPTAGDAVCPKHFRSQAGGVRPSGSEA